MSVLTDDLCFESNVQPSLVYPSLPNTYQQQQQSQDSSRQTCIHFASRLIKLRSELRSPSYMRSNYFPPSSIGRANSLPNVHKDEHPYSNHLDCREDESEILSKTTTDEASQLTYLTELIRRSAAPKPSTKDLLSLPSKQDFVFRQETSKLSRRSVSLRDIIYESIQNKESLAHPVTTDGFSSLALVSQLIYASSSESRTRIKKEEEKVLEQAEQEQEEEEKEKKIVIRDDDLTTTAAVASGCCCTCNKKMTPNSIHPTPSISRETAKSLFSTMSSDSEDEDFIYKKPIVVRKRPTTTAYLVSLSPSSAAAASVAKSRRSNKRQVRNPQTDTTTTTTTTTTT
ncbi:hypothetical protein INT48_007609 [Thamnidium elegans]|uniref:Uncharacterized protein n=1 Tax=Thamnidium elegans TaxID=101142 RepID=A0A8H7VY69_9FUNG|nr:hypothetical protein INT48_007609 [Thamnidium elegans]